MKKIYILTVMIIFSLAAIFLFFLTDENTANKRFLLSFGIKVAEKPCLVEEIVIPYEFDDYYNSYNSLQIESGLTLSPHKGKTGIRYTYKVLNFEKNVDSAVFANVITINSKPVAGDINNPAIDGFILPLSYLRLQK